MKKQHFIISFATLSFPKSEAETVWYLIPYLI